MENSPAFLEPQRHSQVDDSVERIRGVSKQKARDLSPESSGNRAIHQA